MKKRVTLKMIWGQRVVDVGNETRFPKIPIHERVGEIYGPFCLPAEAAKSLGIRKNNQSKVNEVLKGKKKSIEGYTFWYEGEEEHIFKIPQVGKFKRQYQFKDITKHTEQTLKQNLQLMGFEIVSIGVVKGTETKVTVKCCRENCNGLCEKVYKAFVSDESIPVCKKCLSIIKSIVQRQKDEKLYLFEIRPELVSYYDEEENENIPFTTWRKGSKKKIFLTCPHCQYVQTEGEATTPNKYTTRKSNGQFYASFTCAVCNSLKVKFPQIALEWDYSKNGILPDVLSFAMNQHVWWKCYKGHTWRASIDDRTCRQTQCPQCALSAKDSKNGVLMKDVIRRIFPNEQVDDEVPVTNTLYRNDCVVKLNNGQRMVFEMQGDFWHYDEKKLVKNDKELYHKDVKKFEVNRAQGDLVFLINEYDFNLGRNMITEELMEFAIKEVGDYVERARYVVGCDVAYNKKKCQFALNNEQAYYVNRYNQMNRVHYNDKLHPKAKEFARFQNIWKVFERENEYSSV